MDFKEQHKNRFLNIRWHYLICLLLVIAILAVYGQVRDFEFINFDDPIYVTENRYVQQGLTRETFVWAFSGATRETNYWVPLTWLSILLDYELYGMNPGAFHLSNVFFHILNTLLLFFVFCRMTGLLWRSAFVAALFALHPLHVESVAWVTERKDVLSTFFWMLTLLAYSGYVKRPDYRRYFLVFLCFVLGMMAKPMLVTLPFVLLLLDYWPFESYQVGRVDADVKGIHHNRVPFLKLLMEKAPFIILIVLISVMTFLTQKQEGAVKSLVDYPMDVRIANALVTYVSYIIKMFWPSGLAFFYPHPGALPLWKPVAAGAVLVLITLLAVRVKTRHPYFIVGWLWYLGTLFPVIGLVVIGHYVMADRYTYVPLIGLFVIISWAGAEVVSGGSRGEKGLIAIAIVILSVLSIISWRQVGHWRNSVTLCKHAIAVTEKNISAYMNLGAALASGGSMDEAIHFSLKALQIDPNNSGAYNNLGIIRQKQGKTAEAIRCFQNALQSDPNFVPAHINLGNILSSTGNKSDALKHYGKALKINPEYAKAHYNIGTILLGQGKLNQSVSHFLKALKIDPVYAEAHNNLGSALTMQGRYADALTHFREAVRILPDYEDARNNLKKYQTGDR